MSPNQSGDGWPSSSAVSGPLADAVAGHAGQDSPYQARSKKEKKSAFSFRVVKPADGDHVSGVSRTVEITVK